MIVAAAVLAAAGVAGVAGCGGATSPPLAWTAARAPLPADAYGGSKQHAWLSDVACPAAGSCVAVGFYTVSAAYKPLIETLANGTWTVSGDVAGARVSGLSGVACPAQGSCVAVGNYSTGGGSSSPVVATLSDGTWTAADLPLPGHAARGAGALMIDVKCPVQGTCIATGLYVDHNGDSQALIETLSRGRWTALQAPLPAGAAPPQATVPATQLGSVACPAVGSCVAVGQYTTRGGAAEAFIDTLSGGTWTPATAPLPADAAADGQLAGLYGISCRAPGNCVAAGHYTSRGGQARYLAETLSGTWTAATPPLPAGAAATQAWNTQQSVGTTLDAVACQAAGSCVAVGSYMSGSGTVDGSIDTLSGGTWTAVKAPLPPGAATTKQQASFYWVVCPAPGNCVVVGSYTAQDGSTQALVETATGKHG